MTINPNGISTYARFPLDEYLNSEIKNKNHSEDDISKDVKK